MDWRTTGYGIDFPINEYERMADFPSPFGLEAVMHFRQCSEEQRFIIGSFYVIRLLALRVGSVGYPPEPAIRRR